MAISEKEMAAVSFVALAALAKRLTGADLVVTLKDSNGTVFSLRGDEGSVSWIEPGCPAQVRAETVEAARSVPPLAARLTDVDP